VEVLAGEHKAFSCVFASAFVFDEGGECAVGLDVPDGLEKQRRRELSFYGRRGPLRKDYSDSAEELGGGALHNYGICETRRGEIHDFGWSRWSRCRRWFGKSRRRRWLHAFDIRVPEICVWVISARRVSQCPTR